MELSALLGDAQHECRERALVFSQTMAAVTLSRPSPIALRYRLSVTLALALMRPPARYFEYDAFSHFGTDVQHSCDVGGIG
jgi:hypothetical protein